MSAEVISILRGFDPRNHDAERRYDQVAERMNRLSALRVRNRRVSSELERQFVENDLIAASGRRRGQPLTAAGRRRRLDRLIAARSELDRIDAEYEGLSCELEAMNRALEAWVHATFGAGGDLAAEGEQQP